MHFRSLVCYFILDSPQFLNVAFNSFSKGCPNVLSVVFRFVALKALIMGKVSVFITKRSAKQPINTSY